VEGSRPNPPAGGQADLTKIWAGSTVGWAYLVSVFDCCTREIVGWDLSNRCRTEEALATVERAVLERLPAGSRGAGLTLTTDNGTLLHCLLATPANVSSLTRIIWRILHVEWRVLYIGALGEYVH
jgi:transposase InsO family protein